METIERTGVSAARDWEQRGDAETLGEIDPAKVVVSYDRDSDTLMVHLYGRGFPAVSIYRGDGWYMRWNREQGRVIGLQLEGFLAQAVWREPDLLDALDVADLRGITLEEIARVRCEVAQAGLRRDATGLTRLSARLWESAARAGEDVEEAEEAEAG